MSEPEKVIRGDSGAMASVGYEIRIFEDRSEAHLELDERHLNRRGFMHGGFYALLLDSCCGYAASRALSPDASQLVVTLNLTTNYLAPADGKQLKAVGWATRAGRSVVFCNGKIFNDREELIATCSATFKTTGAGKT